jgi:hypothetical protein
MVVLGADGEVGCQGYDAGHVEHHNLLGSSAYRRAERARAAVVEVGHVDDVAATAARDVSPMTFGTGECRCLRHR